MHHIDDCFDIESLVNRKDHRRVSQQNPHQARKRDRSIAWWRPTIEAGKSIS